MCANVALDTAGAPVEPCYREDTLLPLSSRLLSFVYTLLVHDE